MQCPLCDHRDVSCLLPTIHVMIAYGVESLYETMKWAHMCLAAAYISHVNGPGHY